MQRVSGFTKNKNNGGFTLFEMIVVICSIVILYMVAEERMNELPAAAERASFYATLEQIKSGVKFEMINKLASGRLHELIELSGSNPMAFLLEAPGNYRGELEIVTDANVRRRSWYFENSTGQLVYVVGGPSIENVLVNIAGIEVNLGQIRLQLGNEYSSQTMQSEGALNRNFSHSSDNWQGILLLPVYAFSWERVPEQAISIAQ